MNTSQIKIEQILGTLEKERAVSAGKNGEQEQERDRKKSLEFINNDNNNQCLNR